MKLSGGLLIWIAAGLLVSSCSDTISPAYPDKLTALQQGKLAGKGWMPEEILDSARDITASHDPDRNIGAGQFTFDVAEFPAWQAKMNPCAINLENVPGVAREGSWKFFHIRNFIIGVDEKTGEGRWHVQLRLVSAAGKGSPQ